MYGDQHSCAFQLKARGDNRTKRRKRKSVNSQTSRYWAKREGGCTNAGQVIPRVKLSRMHWGQMGKKKCEIKLHWHYVSIS